MAKEQLTKRFKRSRTAAGVSMVEGNFQISHRHFSSNERRRMTGNWFKISSANGSVCRILRFNASLSRRDSEDHAEIRIDYDAWLKLLSFPDDLSEDVVADLSIRRASWYDVLKSSASDHPNPSYRLATQLALLALLISFTLGILGVVL